MIKAMAPALPTCTMATLDIPTKICDNLDTLSRKFWWNPKNSNGRYLALEAWDKLCIRRSAGGLGFKKAKDIKKSLIAKLASVVASKRASLYIRLFQSKYKVR